MPPEANSGSHTHALPGSLCCRGFSGSCWPGICAGGGGRAFPPGVAFLDSLLADSYTRHVSIKVMEHAAELDLLAYENPVFYDRLERARVQATDRIAMIQAIGRLVQQVITAVACRLDPVVLALASPASGGGVIPAFLGESHFAFIGYSMNFRQTLRRQLDYLRHLGASKESAKELKLFGLSGFLTDRYTRCRTGSTTRT